MTTAVHRSRWIIFILGLCTIQSNGHYLDQFYCGQDNCYELLGVTRESTKQEIAKNYRQLARKYHPDVHHGVEQKQVAEELFKKIATAYEVLKDEESRNDYNYMLDNPQEYYSHFYRYYRRKTKIDVRLVVVVTISIISCIQYISRWQRYDTAIKYFMSLPKYRNKALEMINQSQSNGSTSGGKRIKLSKAEQKKEHDEQIRKVIENNMDIQGAYAKPEIKDILWIQLFLLPYTIGRYCCWAGRWIWKFTILKQPYGREEQLYIIRRNMKLTSVQFDAIETETVDMFLKQELWITSNFERWKTEQENEKKKQMADNPRYKAYRRYMKNHGPGRLTFEE
ncbi:dnaJ homolog subfamily C member 25 homolog [Anopheles ziemanni]|uniref:dnaJ homolog subfamily C member 25 homolog n=1 Tax=Anopheles coustani TaxID=139045 RepID=UPI00265A0F68|nr:dnaJ homolog subfamily C member 25 homolog [Anopheles coustani]XP_058176451.1 dnaJ homolog subfamily C member 25 homolog [Anopheles ziemanni]